MGQIRAISSTDLFIGPPGNPRQVVRVTLANNGKEKVGEDERVRVTVEGPGVTTPEPVTVTGLKPGEERVVEVGVTFAAPITPGTSRRVTAMADAGVHRYTSASGDITVADTGWTMWMVSHFHYDPVWWNTQAAFTEVYYDLPEAEKMRPPEVKTAFDLCRAHLEAARHDPDYKFVLAELDYLKPYWDAFPEDRKDLKDFLAEGRIEIVGGNYNEANTNLTHPESTVRNAVYGMAYQRDVVGGRPESAWMLDVFGHDPAYPGLMADAGLTSSAWARGPFHMWGPNRHVGDNTRMEFPSEFEWISPDGKGLLTSYMANHYGAGWDMERFETLPEAAEAAYNQFRLLKPVAATRNVLLPVGADHVIPSRWCTEVHRDWAKRYVWPRFTVGLPREFFAAVRDGDGDLPGARALSPQSRDMNPVYTGKDVSYIDTKQAQRAAEIAVLDGERLATLSTLLGGARYPSEALDKAWRHLVYGAHHDAITGSESDQVYVDLLGSWREAYELGEEVRRGAIDHIASHADTTGEGDPLIVVNTLSWKRDGITSVRLSYEAGQHSEVGLRDDSGASVPTLATGVRHHDDGSLAEVTLRFRAYGVPPLGYRVYRVVPGAAHAEEVPLAEPVIENEAFRVVADPARGGAIVSIYDKRAGRELLRDGLAGNELYLQEEHPTHPFWGEGPWHLLPKGPGRGSAGIAAEVRAVRCPIGHQLIARYDFDGLRISQEIILWDGIGRIDFRTHVDGSIGQDRLLRVRFPFDVPGARPVSETGFAAIGRSYGFPDADAAETPWTLDNPAHNWTGLSAPVRIRLSDSTEHAIGVAEVIADDPVSVRALVARLAGQGVTATTSRTDGPRYGALDVDSNMPDVRIAVGGPDDNAFAAEVLASAGAPYVDALASHGRVLVPPERLPQWAPDADLRGARDLPVLIVAPGGASDGEVTADRLAHALATLVEDLGDAVIEAPGRTLEPLDGYSVALLNRGIPGFVTSADGSVHLNLMRSCSTWPCGVWIDGEKRTAPDGSSFAWQHWSHTYDYSLVGGLGDWRDAGFVRAGQEYNHAVLAAAVTARKGSLPASASLGAVEPDRVVLTTLKPQGNPLAAAEAMDATDRVVVRAYESSGQPARATLRLHGGLSDAHITNIIEETAAESLPVADDRVHFDVAASGIVTLAGHASVSAAGPRELGLVREPAQPVYTRYWLHNKGPAPIGNLPVAVHMSRTEPDAVRITVACSTRPASGEVELDVPPGFEVSAPPLAYDLRPGSHAEFTVRVQGNGSGFLAARIRDGLGQVLEDAVAVGGAGPEPLDVTLEQPELRLPPGGVGSINVRLANRSGGEIRGEAQLASPLGTWGPDSDSLITPWTQGFAVAPGEVASLRYVVRVPADARSGSHWWALVRVSYFGRLHYTKAIPVEVALG